MEIKVVENVLKLNDEIAQLNRKALMEAGVVCVNLLGSPGSGKTALLERTLDGLRGVLRIGVITGDLTTTRDAERLARYSGEVIQINTGKGCHLEANQVKQGLDSLDLSSLDLLIIENVGNLICPVGFDLGQDVKVAIFSVTEGDDKPAKHPYAVLESSVLILNKMDLVPHVPFDLDVFLRDVQAIRGDISVLQLSALRGDGLDAWMEWLKRFIDERRKKKLGSDDQCTVS